MRIILHRNINFNVSFLPESSGQWSSPELVNSASAIEHDSNIKMEKIAVENKVRHWYIYDIIYSRYVEVIEVVQVVSILVTSWWIFILEKIKLF